MAVLTTKNTVLADSTDSVELLQGILAAEYNETVSYQEAYEIGQSLISLCRAFTAGEAATEQGDDSR